MTDNSVQAPHEDICNQALKHYEELSNKCSHYNNTVVMAIEFYKKHASRQPTGIELLDGKMLEDISKTCYSVFGEFYVEDFIDKILKRFGTPKERLVELDEKEVYNILGDHWDVSRTSATKAICQRFGHRPVTQKEILVPFHDIKIAELIDYIFKKEPIDNLKNRLIYELNKIGIRKVTQEEIRAVMPENTVNGEEIAQRIVDYLNEKKA